MEFNRPIYFLHIPKTAGATLISLIDRQFADSEIFPPLLLSQLTDLPGFPGDLRRCRLVRGHFDYIMASLLDQPQIITMLRDPVERTLSQFAHMMRSPDMIYWCRGNIGPDSLIEQFFEEPGFANMQTRSFISDLVGAEKLPLWDTSPFSLNEEAALAIAEQRLGECVVVGLSERFIESLHLLYYRFAWKPVFDCENLNVSSNRLLVDQLLPSMRSRIEEVNRLDRALYDRGKAIFEADYARMLAEMGIADETLGETERHAQVVAKLEERYRQRRRSEFRPSVLMFDFRQPIQGANWQLRESYGEGLCKCWTGPGTISTLDFVLSAEQDQVLELGILGALTPTILESLTVKVNGELIQMERATSGSLIRLRGYVPRLLLAREDGLITLTLQVRETARPKDICPGSTDFRSLGISLAHVKFEPA